MNAENYATLEASKRLAEAGIVLETEAIWHCAHGFAELKRKGILNSSIGVSYPAPSMAEVWRELPYGRYIQMVEGGFVVGMDDGKASVHTRYTSEANPTDALIDLLIWVRRKESRR